MSTSSSTGPKPGPKPAFYLVALLVIAGLVWFAFSRMSSDEKPEQPADAAAEGEKPAAEAGKKGDFTDEEIKKVQVQAESPDSQGITTAKEYSYVPSEKLPEVKGVSGYKPMEARTVRFAINVWAGWAPIIFANDGLKAGKVWQTPGGEPFKVELVLIDDPVAMRDAFAAGDLHIGWGTVDMLPLYLEGLQKDPRVMPRVFQQVDWSNGGDGIVVREGVKTVGDLRGKTVVLAQNSPSHFFLLNALINAGVQPSEVKMKFTADAFQAAAAFNADTTISGCVSWAPDIYNLAKVQGNRLLVTTGTANKLIADVWFARADFAKDHRDIIEGIVRGIFDATEALKAQEAKVAVSKRMAEGFNIPEPDTLGMLADAHWTNAAENREFFLNQNNPTNFERTYEMAVFFYRKIGSVTKPVAFDQVVDFSLLQKLLKEPKYADQKDEYTVQFTPTTAATIQVESEEILTKTIVIHFFPNSWDLEKKVAKQVAGKDLEELYDPNAAFVIEEVGKLAGQYGAARIVVEGHTDGSMRGRVDDVGVKELAANRANAVKEAIVKKFNTLQANQFAVSGVGWDRPADPRDPTNHAKNRRVEIKVYPLEAVK
jgi:ABC-type nitrate/sulfonate/bicarbonate transport system substrate-binding protein/outer membrane protein OmpA-like peptidoglycan-associated protein